MKFSSSAIHGGRPASALSSSSQIDVRDRLILFLAKIDKICLGETTDTSYLQSDLRILKNHFGNLNFLAEHYYETLKKKHEFSSHKYDFNRLIILFPKLPTTQTKSIDVSFYKRLKELYQEDKLNPLRNRYIEKFYSQGEDNQNDFFKQFLRGEKPTELSSLFSSQLSFSFSKTTSADSLYSAISSPFSYPVYDSVDGANKEKVGKEIDNIRLKSNKIFREINQHENNIPIDPQKRQDHFEYYDSLYSDLKLNLDFLLTLLIHQNKPGSITNWSIKKLLIEKLEIDGNKDPVKEEYLSALKSQSLPKKHEDLLKKSTTSSTATSSNLALLTRIAKIERASKASRDFDKIILLCENINKYLIKRDIQQEKKKRDETSWNIASSPYSSSLTASRLTSSLSSTILP